MSNVTLTREPIPAQNSAANSYVSDVVGNKTDNSNGDSLYSLSHIIEHHMHSASRCYPDLAGGVTVTAAAGAWTLGNYVEIVPANTITDKFDIHFVDIETVSTDDNYQLELYYGDSDTFASGTKVSVPAIAGASVIPTVPTITPLIPANSRIRARLACAGGAGATMTFSIRYHEY